MSTDENRDVIVRGGVFTLFYMAAWLSHKQETLRGSKKTEESFLERWLKDNHLHYFELCTVINQRRVCAEDIMACDDLSMIMIPEKDLEASLAQIEKSGIVLEEEIASSVAFVRGLLYQRPATYAPLPVEAA